jgi:hypothetical protein
VLALNAFSSRTSLLLSYPQGCRCCLRCNRAALTSLVHLISSGPAWERSRVVKRFHRKIPRAFGHGPFIIAPCISCLNEKRVLHIWDKGYKLGNHRMSTQGGVRLSNYQPYVFVLLLICGCSTQGVSSRVSCAVIVCEGHGRRHCQVLAGL